MSSMPDVVTDEIKVPKLPRCACGNKTLLSGGVCLSCVTKIGAEREREEQVAYEQRATEKEAERKREEKEREAEREREEKRRLHSRGQYGLGVFGPTRAERRAKLDSEKKGIDERETALAAVFAELDARSAKLGAAQEDVKACLARFEESSEPDEAEMNALVAVGEVNDNEAQAIANARLEASKSQRQLDDDKRAFEARMKSFHEKYGSPEERQAERRARQRARSLLGMHKGSTAEIDMAGKGTSRKARQAAKKRKLTGGTGRVSKKK